MILHDKPLRLIVGSAHVEILDDSEKVVAGAYGINDQQAIDRLKRLIGHLLKEAKP